MSEFLKSVTRRGVDGDMLHLIKMWLKAPVEETDERGKKHHAYLGRGPAKKRVIRICQAISGGPILGSHLPNHKPAFSRYPKRDCVPFDCSPC
jgi:hypothetical protein